ncbi:MAG: proton-conducting transporter membrane subunit, partial [Bacillota bacterium]|nr:proton-conducting transporter membrane subunit [Bacillota bacterium]
MNGLIMLLIIIIPAASAVLAFLAPQKAKEPTAVVGTAANLIAVISVYGRELTFFKPWAGFGIDFSLRLYSFSGLILLCAAVFSFLTALYSAAFFKGKAGSGQYTAYFLLTVTLINGAVMANNLALLLFFWEGILATMFLMIMSGGKDAYKTSVKAVIIVGLTDLCMMLGIGLTGYLAKTLEMDKIHLPIASLGTAAFLLLVIGALGKAGAMPFHTWIPDAADNAPTPFMAFMPGAAEKLLGIYLLFRICADLYKFEPGSP